MSTRGGIREFAFRPGAGILLVKLGSIGDVVCTLPLLNRLRRGLPQARLGWLIEPKSHPVVSGHDAVDRFIVHERGGGWAAIRETLAQVRDFSPGLVLDLQRIARSAFFTATSGAPQRLGFDRWRSKEFSWLATNEQIPPADPGRHMVEQYLEFADYLGLPPGPIEFNLPRSATPERVAEILAPIRGRRYLAFNIGAAKPANRWSPEHWRRLSGLAGEAGWQVVITGGREDLRTADLVRGEGEKPVLNLAGETSLPELIEVLAGASAVVTGDTGPMHIASALGIPTIALFGPANPRRTGPYRHGHLVIRSGIACAPCGRRRCRHPLCMEGILPETVWNKVTSVVAEE